MGTIGQCGCLNCPAGDASIGEQTFEDITLQNIETNLLPFQPIPGGQPLPQGSYFLKYCGGYSGNLLGAHSAELVLPSPVDGSLTVTPFPPSAPTPRVVDYETMIEADGCLGIPFYYGAPIPPPLSWGVTPGAYLTFGSNVPPGNPPARYRLYRYSPQLKLISAYVLYMGFAGGLYKYGVSFYLRNPGRGVWQFNNCFLRIQNGVTGSSALLNTSNVPASIIIQPISGATVGLFYNATVTNAQLALSLSDGPNTNADILLDTSPKLFFQSVQFRSNSVFGGFSYKTVSITIGNAGIGPIYPFTATLSGNGVNPGPAGNPNGGLSVQGNIDGFGSTSGNSIFGGLGQIPTNQPALTTIVMAFTPPAGQTAPLPATLTITAPGVNFSFPVNLPQS